MVNNTNASKARALGAELRAARQRIQPKSPTLQELARQLGRSHTDLSRWETGKRVPSESDVAALLGILRVVGEERDALLALARDANDPNWIAPGVNRQLAALIEDEKTAHRIITVQPLIIPGLLQTEDYARSIMVGAGASRGEVDQRVLVRMGRQRVLTRRNPPEFVAVIGEHALRYPPCDATVMIEQLQHLLAMTEQPNIAISVLPLNCGYAPAIEGPFVLLEFGQTDPVVQQEHYRSTTTVTDKKDVRDYQTAAEMTRSKAMSPADSAGLIADLHNQLERTL